jgi:hypothetical protein
LIPLVIDPLDDDEETRKLKQAFHSLSDRLPSRTTYEDTETPAKAQGLIPRTVTFNGLVEEAMKDGQI